jgi:hypothetical protein
MGQGFLIIEPMEKSIIDYVIFLRGALLPTRSQKYRPILEAAITKPDICPGEN